MDAEWEAAAKAGDGDTLRAMLERGASPDARDQYGQTALMIAAPRGHLACCRVLIEAGAAFDVTAKYGLSALMLAVVNDQESVARLLFEAGADSSIRGSGAPGFDGKTAADLAGDRRWTDLARLLSSATLPAE